MARRDFGNEEQMVRRIEEAKATATHLELLVVFALVPASFPSLLHELHCYQSLSCILGSCTCAALHGRQRRARRESSMPIAEPYGAEGAVPEHLDGGVGARRS
jgi:hypothetical protein